ncbi:MAG: 2-hydroxy-6-oxohepta-2,4-dienoate hydrolase [Candidatus Parcubacteria bacterium]|nr:MAG: 2-hydroxy-6-oxohepta-2,4-dienoate hydrolase [Candidatus Parcubacteria bacterium]
MKKIIFLHGWVNRYIINKEENIRNFYNNLIKELSSKFEIYFPILPGFSKENDFNKPLFLDDYIDYLKNYIEKQGIDFFYLMGHSFGGQVAAKFTYYYPEKVEKLILYNAACIRKKSLKRIIFRKVSPLFKKIIGKNLFLSKLIYKILTGNFYYVYYSEHAKQTMANIINEDLSSILPYIHKETIIIWGEKDRLTPLWQGRLINKLIKKSKLIIYPNGNHNFHLKDSKFIVDCIN